MTKGIIIFFVGLSVLALILNGAANWVESKPSPPERKFKVVDRYNGCDVVRYTPDYSAKFAYFLDCK
jgi:hypothetical protein